MEITVIALAVAAAAIAVIYVVSRKSRSEGSFLLFQQQLDAIREQLRSSLDSNSQIVTGHLSATRKAMDERLDNAARVIGDVQKTMGRIHESLVPVGEIRDILKAPKLRGGFGEVMLEKLLEEMMPAKLFSTQYAFSDGDRVDAIINIGGQLVPIDSKFPLDKYQEYLNAATDDGKKQARKGLVSAVKKHINDVAKYIRPDEGTYPFALMYIPSENIYYELFVSGSGDDSLWPYAVNLRIFPVSSNTLYIYLQTISFGLKGMQIAEHAKELLNKLEQLQKNFGDIRKNFEKIGTHLKNAQGAFEDTDKRLDKFEGKFATIESEVAPALAEPKMEEVQVVQ